MHTTDPRTGDILIHTAAGEIIRLDADTAAFLLGDTSPHAPQAHAPSTSTHSRLVPLKPSVNALS